MHPERPILRRPPAAPLEPAARAAGSSQPAPRSGSDGYGNRETWRRILAAHVQPLADAAD
jgi:hypothetical protein